MDDNKKTTSNTSAKSTSAQLSRSYLLEKENRQLHETLDQLIESAKQNQATQDKFYQLELYFLESTNLEILLSRILCDLKRKLRLAQVELVLLDPDSEIQHLICEIYGEISIEGLRYVENMAVIKNLYESGLTINLVQDTARLQKLFEDRNQISKSAAVIPLVRSQKLIGSLHLGSREPNRFYAGLATNFLQHMASIISVCIENSINQERYIHLSLVDMLTKTKNRRYFFQALGREVARASRSMDPISCLFIDIDHFKMLNDKHGHLIGDQALRQVAACIKPLLRRSDTLARFGGEEFTVLLPGSDLKQAMDIAERIRQTVAGQLLDTSANADIAVTLSIGVNHWLASDQSFGSAEAIQNHLINGADKALYAAKAAGRNCVRQFVHGENPN